MWPRLPKSAEDAGADAVSLVNTFLGMAIDVETRRPHLSNIVGGLSGPAIRPIAVRMVYECRRAVRIPDHRHGRHRVDDGRARIHHRRRHGGPDRHGELRRSVHLEQAARRTEVIPGAASIARLHELVGTLDTATREKEWVSS